jgi:hypothetical protein
MATLTVLSSGPRLIISYIKDSLDMTCTDGETSTM